MNHEGPFFDDLHVGDVFETAPAVTLTEGRAALHQAVLGGRLRLSLDAGLSRRVTGEQLADPALVWDVAIGQSTLVTRRVLANLFYRGLVFHRYPAIGDTLSTRTEVVGLRQSRSRPAGLVALRITTRDQDERAVVDFWRCAMLPLSRHGVDTGRCDDMSSLGTGTDLSGALSAIRSWQLDSFPCGPDPVPGSSWSLNTGDVVTCAPELARLTLNLAHVHHDEFQQPHGRLVYGGHVIGLALAQVTRVLPNILTVVAWRRCDHVAPVREYDTLRSTITVDDVEQLDDGLAVVGLRVLTHRTSDRADRSVLDWGLTAVARTPTMRMPSGI